MSNVDNSKMIEFYEECLGNGFTDFEDEYQNFKIQNIAKKHGITETSEITKELFSDALNLYYNHIKQLAKEKELNRNRALDNRNRPLLKLNGKDKRIYEFTEQMNKLSEAVKAMDELKAELVESYYSGNKQDHDSWFWQGLGVELATGSRIAGSLAVAEVNEKNRQIDVQNAQLKKDIQNRINNDPNYNTAKHKETIRQYQSKIDEYKDAFVSKNKSFTKYISYDNLKWEISEYDGSTIVSADVWLKEKPQMPSNIKSTLDGVCKAVIYRKSDKKIATEVLVPLPMGGIGFTEESFIAGINIYSHLNRDEINHEEYDAVLTDYNICAIEDSECFTSKRKGIEDQKLSDWFYYNYVNNITSQTNIDSIKNAISILSSIDSVIDGKENQIESLKNKLSVLEVEKAENDRIAEERRKAAEQERLQKEKEEKENKHRLAQEALERERARKQKQKKKMMVIVPTVVCLVVFLVLLFTVVIPGNNYIKALIAYNNHDYDTVINLLSKQENYKDSSDYLKDAKYNKAIILCESDDIETAKQLFEEQKDYKNSDYYLTLIDLKEYQMRLGTADCFQVYDELSEKRYNYNDIEQQKIEMFEQAKEGIRKQVISKAEANDSSWLMSHKDYIENVFSQLTQNEFNKKLVSNYEKVYEKSNGNMLLKKDGSTEYTKYIDWFDYEKSYYKWRSNDDGNGERMLIHYNIKSISSSQLLTIVNIYEIKNNVFLFMIHPVLYTGLPESVYILNMN